MVQRELLSQNTNLEIIKSLKNHLVNWVNFFF